MRAEAPRPGRKGEASRGDHAPTNVPDDAQRAHDLEARALADSLDTMDWEEFCKAPRQKPRPGGGGILVDGWINPDDGALLTREGLQRLFDVPVLPRHAPPAARQAPTTVQAVDPGEAQGWYSRGVEEMLSDLRAAHDWPEGYRDDKGRGWEKLCADIALKLQRYAAAASLDEAELRERFVAAAPRGGDLDERWLRNKWRSQTAKAEKLGPWPLPDNFGSVGSIFQPRQAEVALPAVEPATVRRVAVIEGDQPSEQRRVAHELVRRPAYRDRLRHADGLGWLAWDGTRWQPGAEKAALAAVDRLLGELWAEIRGDATKETLREMRSLQRASAMKGALTIAASLAPYTVPLDALDADPLLLNCANGTLDLRTGNLRPHDPADLLTKATRGAYHPKVNTGEWEAFLARILPSEPVRSFLQRYVGSSLEGRVRDHILAILNGEGANGKGTTDRAIAFTLGDYATVAHPRILMREEGNEYDKVALRGARWVTMSETERDRKMSESTMKALTGGDVVQARIPYQLPMRFRPSHTLALITNHLPTVSGDDAAVWRRLRVVPFDVIVPESEWITDLDERLELHADAILGWAVAGYNEYRKRGLDAPPEVLHATEEYREESDDVARFIDARCVVGPHLSALATPIFEAYVAWCGAGHVTPLNQTAFGRALTRKGFTSGKAGGLATRGGLSLRHETGWLS